MRTLGTVQIIIVFLQMSSTWPHPQFQLRMLLWTSSKNKYFAFISPAQWKHFSKLLPRWYLVLFWVSSPCSWLSNGQTCLIVILKEKNTDTSCIFKELYCSPHAGSDTKNMKAGGKKPYRSECCLWCPPYFSQFQQFISSSQRKGLGNVVRKWERNITALCSPCPFGINQLFTFFKALLAIKDSVSKNTI